MSGFSDRLASEHTTLALCWRIVRSDGVALGFTTHDVPIDHDGLRHAPAPGMIPSAIAQSGGLDAETMDIGGALAADAMTANDLASGRYDDAAVTVFMIDWRVPDAGTLLLARGTLGSIECRSDSAGGSYTAELLGPTSGLDAITVETCSPDCRAELGDRRCRVDLAPLTLLARAAQSPTRDTVVVSGVVDPQRFANGRLRPLGGANAGIDRRICALDGNRLILFEALPFALADDTRIELREGCDKRLATCGDRFANAINFRGEPHVPGTDMLTRFPGA